jgi:hypothetical protein
MDDVTLQYLQSVIAIQIRLTPQRGTRRGGEHVPEVYLRLAFAVVIGATLFKSLSARSSRRDDAGRRDDEPARLVPTPAPRVVTAATRAKDP